MFMSKGYKAAMQEPMAVQQLVWPWLSERSKLGGLARCCGGETKGVAVPFVNGPSGEASQCGGDEQRAPSPCSGDLWYALLLLLFLLPQRVRELQLIVQLCKRRETDWWSLPYFFGSSLGSVSSFSHIQCSVGCGEEGSKTIFRCYPMFSGVRK